MFSNRDPRFTRIVESNVFSNSNTDCDEDCEIAPEVSVSDPELQLLPDILYEQAQPLHPWKTVFRRNTSAYVTAMRNYPDFYSLNREKVVHLDLTALAADDYSTPHQSQGPAEGEMLHEYNFEIGMKNLRIYEGLKKEDTSPFPLTSLDDPSELFTCLVSDRIIYNELEEGDIIERAMEMLTLKEREGRSTPSVEDHKETSTQDEVVDDNDKQTTRRYPLRDQNLNVGVDVDIKEKEKGTLLMKENDGGATTDVKEPPADEIKKENAVVKTTPSREM